MLVLNLTAGATTNNTPISCTKQINTNSNVKLSNNTVTIYNSGIYKITGCSTLTSSSAANYGYVMYINGTAANQSFYSSSGASGEITTVPMSYVLNVTSNTDDSYVELTFMPIGVPTVVNGTIIIEKVS